MHRLGANLRQCGVERGQLVGLLYPTGPDFVIGFFGIMAAGAAVSPLARPTSVEQLPAQLGPLLHLLEAGGFDFLLAHPELESALDAALAGTRTRLLRSSELTREIDRSGLSIGPDDLALVQFTSGSTAHPKGVALRHRNVLAGLDAIATGMQIASSDINGQWLPLHHDMGLIGMLVGIAAGIDHYIWPPFSFIRDPGKWIAEFARQRCTIYAGPNFSYQQMLAKVSDAQLAELDLSCCRLAFNGAEPIDARCIEAFLARFGPVGFRPQAMFPVYGLAEVTLAATFPELGAPIVTQTVDRVRLANHREVVRVEPGHAHARTLVGVGRAVKRHELRIVDDDDRRRALPPGRVGHVELRGPAVMESYRGRTAADSQISDDGWLRTGDLGYCDGGQLFVCGRAKEMIIIRGTNFYALDVEQAVSDAPGVFRMRSVAFGIERNGAERIAVLVESRLGEPDLAHELANALRVRATERLAVTEVEVYVLRPNSIEYTTSGKPRRVAMRDRLLHGQLTGEIVGGSSLARIAPVAPASRAI